MQELIDQLNKIENKNLPIDCTIGTTGVSRIEKGAVLDLETITIRTNTCGSKQTAAIIVLNGEIIHTIIAGTLEKDIGIEQLKQAMPFMWDDQKKMFGME